MCLLDPADLVRLYPADAMVSWPVSTRVNTPKNDDVAILDRIETATGATDPGRSIRG